MEHKDSNFFPDATATTLYHVDGYSSSSASGSTFPAYNSGFDPSIDGTTTHGPAPPPPHQSTHVPPPHNRAPAPIFLGFNSASTYRGTLEPISPATTSLPLNFDPQGASSFPDVSNTALGDGIVPVDPRHYSTPISSGVTATDRQGPRSTRTVRYNPMAGVRPQRSSSIMARRDIRSEEEDVSIEEAEIGAPSPDTGQHRREGVRRQRTESDKRQRDVLRSGFDKLKATLPNPNPKASKVAILDGAADYIGELKTSRETLQTRLESAQAEMARMRDVNEQMLRAILQNNNGRS